jgi:transposase-like protein
MREHDWTKLLGWPGYRVYRHAIDEQGQTLKLWVRRKRGNGNIKALLRRGRGYCDLNYLLLKAQRLAATKTEFVAFQKAA